MKKTLLSLSILFSLASAAQLTQSNHAPAVGDPLYSTQQCDSTAIIPSAPGAGQTWNYALNGLNVVKTYSTYASTDVSFNPATVYVGSSMSNMSYYLPGSTDLKYYGGIMSINGTVITVKYASPAIVAAYPMSLNTSTASTTSGSVNVGLDGTFTGNCNVTADATGTLVLPAKTFTNVIRVNTVQTMSATLSGGLATATVTMNNYDYYETNASKAPIFSISTSTLLSSVASPSYQKLTTVIQNYSVVGINETEKEKIDLSVFPNPTTNFINFSTASLEATKVNAFDLTGKAIATEVIEKGKATMNTASFSAGVYLYHVTDKNNRILTSGKFTVSK